eukprot:gb/GFBE01036829.1/.p1 GENE.gb/GFBE01036829.1/~~gb/GFBE01036829.1/.p1  ORF type:complete len:182 (+),score=48.09 gb/GFBE01036829.1/:1-546(+)
MLTAAMSPTSAWASRCLRSYRTAPLHLRVGLQASSTASSSRSAATSSGSFAKRQQARAEDPRAETFEERGFAARDKRRAQRYWPPPQQAMPPLELPGGRKQVQIIAAKSDVDGSLEAQVAFMTKGGHRLFYLNEEELDELEKLAPRISEYFELWEEKTREEQDGESEKQIESALKQPMLPE